MEDFVRGLKRSVPIIVAAAPFGMLFGTLAVKNGFSVFEAVLASATIFAGASQMVGIELFGDQVAPWLIVFSIFAVNFRHILYSATVGRAVRHFGLGQKLLAFGLLTDPQFAECERQTDLGKTVSFTWYMGIALPVYVLWVLEAYIGAVFGNLISDPQRYGIDFLLPIYFLGLVMGFRRRPLWLPVVIVSGIVSTIAYWTIGSPWHVSIGAIAGVGLAMYIGPAKTSENS